MFVLDLIPEHVNEFDAGCFEDRQVVNVLTLSNLQLRNHQLLQVRTEHIHVHQQFRSSVLVCVT